MKVYFNNSCKICRAEINLYKKQNIKDENVSTISLPNINFTANNSISLQEKGGIDLNPYTCEEIKHKDFEISDFFEELHYGGIGSILFKFLSPSANSLIFPIV